VTRTLAFLLSLTAPSVAMADPADVFFVIDTSASMDEPAPSGDGTKLDAARALVGRLAVAAESAGHRVALLRFRQRTVDVPSGEGPVEVVVEAEDQCERGADVLVPLGPGEASSIAQWVDGVGGQGVPEVAAAGDSPLYASARVALRYIDGLRVADPGTHCVRAVIVLVTDGEDTCAGGAELLETIDELDAVGPAQGIQTLVVSFDGEAEAAARLAGIGREEADPRVFTPAEGDDLEGRLGALDGRVVIEGCGGAMGPPPSTETDAGPDAEADAGVDAGPCEDSEGGGGCSVGAGATGSTAWLALLGLVLLVWRRRAVAPRLAIVAALAVGCGGGDAPTCDALDAGPAADGGAVDAGGAEPADPAAVVDDLSAGHAVVRAALEEALEDARALVEPSAAFDAIDGDPVAGCRALVDTVAFEPYYGAQRGVRGCLATRRCNSLDQTLLLQACLDHHGVSTTVTSCRFDGELDDVAGLDAQEPVMPDVAPIDDALRDAMLAHLESAPPLRDALVETADAWRDRPTESVAALATEDADRLAGLTALDPVTTQAAAETSRELGRANHYFLVRDDDGARLDALLDAPTDCFETPLDEPRRILTMTIELLVQNVTLTGTYFAYRAPVSLGSVDVVVHERWGEPIAVAVTGASASAAPDGVPPPTEDGCFRAFIDGTPTASFPLFASDVSDCGGDAAPGLDLEHGFGRLILRTEMQRPGVPGVPYRSDRILVDRFGYAGTVAEAVANGPSFAATSAGRLLPMRVSIQAGGGIPGPHETYARQLADRLARFDAIRAPILERHGGAIEVGPTPPPDYFTTTFALARDALPTVLGDATVRSHIPWRVATIERRVFVPGDGIVDKTIFDLTSVPLSVHHADPDTRLRASLRAGAVFTESERLASMALDRSLRVLHAGPLLRDESIAFGAWDGDPEHEMERFPYGLREAARTRLRDGDELFVTPGAVEQLGSELTSWWRIDPLGVATGDIRYEGTLYGGVTAAKAIAGFTRCLAFQAIVALTGPRVAPDVSCCAAVAFRELVKDLFTDFVMNVVTGGLALGLGSLYGAGGGAAASAAADAAMETVETLSMGIGAAMDISELIELYGDPPECVRLIAP